MSQPVCGPASDIPQDGDQTKYVPPAKTLEATVAAATTACVESAKAAAGTALQVASTVVSEVGERSGRMLSGGGRRDRERRYIQERILEARRLRASDESEEAQGSHDSGDRFEEATLVAPGSGKDTGDGSNGMIDCFIICGEIANGSMEAGNEVSNTNANHHGLGGS